MQPLNRRILVIRNPAAGRRRGDFYIDVVARLRDAGCQVDERLTERRGDAERIARDFDASSYDVLAVAGGDGTINEALSGLAARPDAAAAIEVGIIPLGTANVLAIEIGLETSADHVAAALVAGPTREIHLGRVNDRVFLLMAGVGFDAHVIAAVPTDLKRRFGKLAYALVSVRMLLGFAYPGYRVTVGGETFDAASLIVSNGRYYAGRYIAAPEADLTEPSLKLCVFERNGPVHAARYAVSILLGRMSKAAGLRVVTATEARIEGPSGDPVQGDGDIIGELPANVSVDTAKLRLIYPA